MPDPATPSPALVRLTENDALIALREAQTTLTGLYATIGQQLAATAAKVAGAEALLDNPLVASAFPADHAWRLEIAKFNAALAGFTTLMETVPAAPRIGE